MDSFNVMQDIRELLITARMAAAREGADDPESVAQITLLEALKAERNGHTVNASWIRCRASSRARDARRKARARHRNESRWAASYYNGGVEEPTLLQDGEPTDDMITQAYAELIRESAPLPDDVRARLQPVQDVDDHDHIRELPGGQLRVFTDPDTNDVWERWARLNQVFWVRRRNGDLKGRKH